MEIIKILKIYNKQWHMDDYKVLLFDKNTYHNITTYKDCNKISVDDTPRSRNLMPWRDLQYFLNLKENKVKFK